MPARVLPHLKPFEMDGLPWTFIDARLATGSQNSESMRVLVEQAQEVAKEGRDFEVELCGADSDAKKAMLNRFLRRQERNPKYTWDQYEMSGDSIYSEICPKPWLPRLGIIALRRKTVEGFISLTNMEIEHDGSRDIRARCAVSPGFMPAGRKTRQRVWRIVLSWLIENDLEFKGGLNIDIVGLDFPEDRKYRWSSKDNPTMSTVFDGLDIVCDRTNQTDEVESPLRYRRKGAPDAD